MERNCLFHCICVIVIAICWCVSFTTFLMVTYCTQSIQILVDKCNGLYCHSKCVLLLLILSLFFHHRHNSSSSGNKCWRRLGWHNRTKSSFVRIELPTSANGGIVIYLGSMAENHFIRNMYNYLIQNGRIVDPFPFFSALSIVRCNYNHDSHTIPHRLLSLLVLTMQWNFFKTST